MKKYFLQMTFFLGLSIIIYKPYSDLNSLNQLATQSSFESPLKVLKTRAKDSGYVYPGDLLYSYIHGFVAQPIFKFEYSKGKLPEVLLAKEHKPFYAKVRIINGKRVGDKLNFLNDIEIFQTNSWKSLGTYFEEDIPEVMLENYSALWKNQPQGFFYLTDQGFFAHQREDSSRIYNLNWRSLSISSKEEYSIDTSLFLSYNIVSENSFERLTKNVTESYNENPSHEAFYLVITSDGNGILFVPEKEGLEQMKVNDFFVIEDSRKMPIFDFLLYHRFNKTKTISQNIENSA